MPPTHVAARWTSMFKALDYQHKHFSVEKAFLECEQGNSNRIQLRNKISGDYKFIRFQTSMTVKRMKTRVLSMEIFESDLSCSFFAVYIS